MKTLVTTVWIRRTAWRPSTRPPSVGSFFDSGGAALTLPGTLQEWQKEQARLREKQLGGKSDKKHKKKDKKKGKKKEKKKDKKAKRRDSSSSDTDSDSDSDSDSRSKKAKKSKKDKSDKKDKKDKETSKEILPGRKSDDALVTILREGSSAAEVKQLLTMIDDRQAVLVGGVPPGPRKHLEAFFMSLGMKGKDVPGGPAYVSHSSGGVKLTRHYSHVLEVYKRKQAKAEQEPKPPVLEVAAAPTGPTEVPHLPMPPLRALLCCFEP